jgi:hypothetical protein
MEVIYDAQIWDASTNGSTDIIKKYEQNILRWISEKDTDVSNVRRRKGLRDNIAVIREVDRGGVRYLFLLRLYFVIYWRMLTGKT